MDGDDTDPPAPEAPTDGAPATAASGDAAPLIAEARAAEAAQRPADARRLAAELQARFPAEAAGYQIGIAAAWALDDLAAALDLAERAEAQFPDASWPRVQRVWSALGLGRLDETVELCETLRARFPDEETGYGVGALALRGRDRLAEALAVAETAAARFPGQPEFAEKARELRAVIANRTRALALTERLTAAPPTLARPRVAVVLGMHRTGTSLVARTLADLGVGLGGPLMKPNFGNPEGYFEHVEIVAAHDEALRTMGVSWDASWSAQRKAPRLPPRAYAKTRARLEAIVAKELEANAGLWAFKDPRAMRFLPLWREIFDSLGVEPVWLLCLRDPRAVAASLHARDRIPPAIGELLWIEHVTEALRELGPRLSLIVPYERWFEAPDANLQALARAVGRSADGLVSAARADLRRQTATDRPAAIPLSLALAEALSAPAPDLADLQARATALGRRLQALAAPD